MSKTRWPDDPGPDSAEDFGDSDFMFYGARRAPTPLQPWWRRGLNWPRALRLW